MEIYGQIDDPELVILSASVVWFEVEKFKNLL